MSADLALLRVKAQSSSLNATVLAVVTALGGLVVGLGFISPSQDGLLVATTVSGLGAVGLIANVIHTGSIEPSAITAAVIAVVGQALSLAVSFAWISSATDRHVVVILTAVVLAAAQIAHALLSRTVTA